MYLSVLNLPSHLRYKEAYTIIVGILTGPHEPKYTVNTYMEPLVNDLLAFWSGVSLSVHGVGDRKVRCALLCISCNSPAVTKHILVVLSVKSLFLELWDKRTMLDLIV